MTVRKKSNKTMAREGKEIRIQNKNKGKREKMYNEEKTEKGHFPVPNAGGLLRWLGTKKKQFSWDQ